MKCLLSIPLRVLLPVLLLTCAVIAGLISWKLDKRLLASEIESQFFDEARVEITSLQATLEYNFRTGDTTGVNVELSQMATHNDVIAAYVLDREDRVLAATRNATIGDAAEATGAELPEDLKGRHSAQIAQARASIHGSMALSQDRRVAVAYYPLLVDVDAHALRSRQNGLLVLVFDMQIAKNRAFRAAGRQALDNALVFGGLAACAWVFLHLSLTRRVAQLVATTKQLASGDHTARTRIEGSDELAQVGKAIDSMAARIAEDILHREQVEAELRESERRFSDMLRNLELISMMLDRDGRITWCNDHLLRLTGWQRGELIGRTWLEVFMPPELGDEMRGVFAALLANQPAAWHHENEIITRSGGRRLIEWNNSVLRSASGEVIGTAGIGNDITARKQAEEELCQSREALRELNTDLEERVVRRTEEFFAATAEAKRANHAKSDFLSRTSHELRTPLNAILGFGQLLEMEENLGPETRESVEQILNAGRHLLTLVDEVLNISNAESGTMTLSIEPVEVDRLIKETLCLIRSLDDTMQVEVERASSLVCEWKVLADPQRLKQVLLNLLSNAIKYNRPGGKVIVEFFPVEATDPRVFRFCVRDTGLGISAEKLPRLFTPFDRLDAERTKSHIAGTGLGLALSKRMVELMGGRIGVESVVGEGSTFWIELPLAESPVAPLDESALPSIQNPKWESPKSKTLLCIEDNVSSLRLITHILARRPAVQLLCAETGALGLKMACDHHPDLILLDLHLPDSHGDQVLAQLLAYPRTADIPVVMLGADVVPGKRVDMLAAGARAFITKPVDVRNFLAVLDQFIEFTPEEGG